MASRSGGRPCLSRSIRQEVRYCWAGPVNRDSIVQMRGAVSISSLHRSRTAQRRSNSLSSAAHGLNATAPARAKGLASPCKAYAYWQDTPRKEATREAMSGGMARALG